MTVTRTRTRPGGPRKSPLRLAAEPAPVIGRRPMPPPDTGSLASCSPEDLRQLMISESGQWLRSRTSRHKRPFQEDTISAYQDNRFFRWYYGRYGQGGTNTKQRNLRHLFTWLEAEHGHPHPYTDDLARYAPVKTRPATLAADFIKDLLAVSMIAIGVRPVIGAGAAGSGGAVMASGQVAVVRGDRRRRRDAGIARICLGSGTFPPRRTESHRPPPAR